MTEEEKDIYRIRICGYVLYYSPERCYKETIQCIECKVCFLFGYGLLHVDYHAMCDCTREDSLFPCGKVVCGSCALRMFHFWDLGTGENIDDKLDCTLSYKGERWDAMYIGYSKKIQNPRTKSANKRI